MHIYDVHMIQILIICGCGNAQELFQSFQWASALSQRAKAIDVIGQFAGSSKFQSTKSQSEEITSR